MDNEREMLFEQLKKAKIRFNETFIGHCYKTGDGEYFAYKVIGQSENGNLYVIAICYDKDKPAVAFSEEMMDINPLEHKELSSEEFTKLTQQTLLTLSDAVIKNLKG